MTQIPSVGRDVHYVSAGSKDGTYPSVCRAAKITEVWHGNELVSLVVFNPTGQHFATGVRHDEETKAPMTWHWPERVGE